MEQRLKERLTGAAILVALVVLVVPELFHGHAADRDGGAAAGEGPPLRSYTIDLGGTHTAPMQLSTAPARADASAIPAGPAPTGAAPTATVSTPAAAAVAPAAAAQPPVAQTSAAAAAVASAPARTPNARVSLVYAPGETRASHDHRGPRASGSWSVQLGLFAKRANAEHLLHTAQAKGFSASLSRPDARGRYQVRMAGLTTRTQAVTLAARLRAAGLPAATIGPAAASDPPRVSR
jgi:DedD protein